MYFDVNMEHINYFSVNSLAFILTKCGFSIISIEEVLGGAHIAAYVKKEDKRLRGFEIKKENDIEEFKNVTKKYKMVSIWGAGIKGRSYIQGVVTAAGEKVRYIFDNNNVLDGLYVGNCNIPIVLPTEKKINQSDAIIITALEYRDEITKMLRETYKYRGEILDIGES